MRTNISLSEFHHMLGLLGTLSRVGLIDPFDFMVMWQRKPRMVLTKLGDFEFENPQEVYGVSVTFFDEDGVVISESRYRIGSDE